MFDLGGKMNGINDTWVHHDLVNKIIIDIQNIKSAKTQFIGERWGIW